MLHHSAVVTNTLTEYCPDTEVSKPIDPYAHLNCYQQRALNTRARRQAKGMYKRPTKQQKAAFARYIKGGVNGLEAGDVALLAVHPALTASQRDYFASLANGEVSPK